MGINAWILQARGRGLSDDELREQLAASGWTPDQINQVLAHKPLAELTPTPIISNVPTAESQQRSLKGLRWALIGAIALIVIGGGIFAYTKGYLPIPFGSKSGQELLMESFAKLAEAKTGEFGLTLHVTTENRTVERTSPSQGESSIQQKAKNAQMMSDASQIRTALTLYYDDNLAYPETLDPITPDYLASDLMQADGTPFIYTPSSNLRSYTLSFRCLGENTIGSIDSTGNMVSCTLSDGGDDLYDISSMLDGIFENIPSDLNIQGAITTFIDVNADNLEESNGLLTVAGTYRAGGVTFSLDVEIRMKGGKMYVMINDFPTLLLDSFESLQGQWVEIDTSEVSDSYTSMLDLTNIASEEDTTTYREELGHSFRIAFREKLITARMDGTETINGHPSHRIRFEYDFDKIPATLEAYKQDILNRNVNLGVTDEVSDEEVAQLIEQLKKLLSNSEWTMWVDQASSEPRKIEIAIITVPPDSNEELADKQVRTTIGFTFDHLGETPNVVLPDDTIDYDEAVRRVTGMTVEDQQFQKQYSAVSDIHSALAAYSRDHDAYPDTLEQLLEKPLDEYSGDTYFFTSTPSVPADTYTDKPFDYLSSGDDYILTYTMHLPPETQKPDSGVGFYPSGSSDYLRDLFVEGTNTATKDFLSRETEGTKDTDDDGLTDVEEAQHGTNKYYKDTDFDGYNDLQEIQSGHDPLTAPED